MGEPSPEFDLNLFWKIMVRGRNVLICTDSRSNWGERPWFWGRWRAWLVIFKKVEATKQVGQQHIDPCPYPTWDWHVRISYVWDDFMRCTPWSSKTPFVVRKTSALLDMLGPSKPYALETSWAQNLQLKLKPEETTPKTASHFLEIALFPHFPTFFSHARHALTFFPTFSRRNVGFSHLFHGTSAGAPSRWSGWTTWSFGCGPRSTWQCRRSSMTRCGVEWSGWGGWYVVDLGGWYVDYVGGLVGQWCVYDVFLRFLVFFICEWFFLVGLAEVDFARRWCLEDGSWRFSPVL